MKRRSFIQILIGALVIPDIYAGEQEKVGEELRSRQEIPGRGRDDTSKGVTVYEDSFGVWPSQDAALEARMQRLRRDMEDAYVSPDPGGWVQ